MKNLAAGNPEALRNVQVPFDILGQKTWIFGGGPEQANAIKLVVNYMIASAIGAMGDTLALAQGYEVSKAGYIDLFTSTIAYKGCRGAIEEESVEDAGFKLSLGRTDARLYMGTFFAGEATASLTYQQTERNIAHGGAA